MNSNTLEFFVKMRDFMSGGLVKLQANARNTFKKVQGDVDDAFKKGTGTVNNFFRNLTNKFRSAGQEASGFRSTLSSMGSGLGKMAGILGVLGIGAVGIGAASGLAKDSIGAAMNFGATKESFKVLTGSDKKGVGLANDLNKLQQDTILGPEVFKAAQTMLGFGVATDKVLPDLKMIGDISMGDAQKLESLSLAFSQVTAAGKLQGQDLLQLINAGWNPLQQLIKDKVFPNMLAAKEVMEKGAISAGMVEVALKHATGEGGQFNNMMNKLADTPFGKMQQLQGQWESFKVSLGEALMPLATVGMEFMQRLLDMTKEWLPYITSGVQWLLDLFNQMKEPTGEWAEYLNMAKEYAGIVWEGLSNILSTVFHIVGGVFSWVQQSAILKDTFGLILSTAQMVWAVVSWVTDKLKALFDNVIKPLLNAMEYIYTQTKDLLGLGSDKPVEIKAVVTTDKSGLAATTSNIIASPSRGAMMGKGGGLSDYKGLTGSGAAGDGKSAGAARAVTSGGPRVININGVKFADKIEIHGESMQAAYGNAESKMQEMYLRILNSGASVQSN